MLPTNVSPTTSSGRANLIGAGAGALAGAVAMSRLPFGGRMTKTAAAGAIALMVGVAVAGMASGRV